MEFKLFLGEWVETHSDKIIYDMNPATNTVYARVHTAGREEVDKALEFAYAAQGEWENMKPSDRERVFLRAAEHLETNKERFVEWLINESGSSFLKAFGEESECTDIFRAAAGECWRIDGGVMPADNGAQLSYYIKQPVGVVAGAGIRTIRKCREGDKLGRGA